MKNFLIKYCVVALVCINATIVFAQNPTPIDSLLAIVTKQIKVEEYIAAEKLLDSLKTIPVYKIDSIKLKVDFTYAILYQTQNKDTQALEILLNGLSKVKNDKFSPFIAEYAYEIGSKFSKIKNYEKGFEYFRMVLSNGNYRNDSLDISRGLLGVGSMHFKSYYRSKYNNLRLEEGLQRVHKDSTLFYFKKVIATFPKNESKREILAQANNNLLAYYMYDKEYDLAEFYARKSLDIRIQEGDSIKIAMGLDGLGAITTYKGDLLKAKGYYERALQILDGKEDYKSKDQKLSLLLNIADNYKRREEYKKGYDYLRLAYSLDTNLDLKIDNEKYAEYEAKYNLSEKEKVAEIEKNRRKNAELWLYVFSIATGALMLFLWLVHRSNRYKSQKQELEFQQENLLKERTLEKVQNEAQIKILNATIDGKETERRHIAEILHDSVSALLSSAGLHLQAAKIELKDRAPEEIEKSQAIVREAGEKIRDLSHKLISSVLLKFGLGFAMDDLCTKYSNSKLTFESDAKNIQRYSTEFEIKIHSIIEELVNNIMKHSNATSAQILLKQFNGQLEIRIFDDGDGFDVEKNRKNDSGGLGLTQIEARIKVMKGVFNINSTKEIGTRIFINVPIPNLD